MKNIREEFLRKFPGTDPVRARDLDREAVIDWTNQMDCWLGSVASCEFVHLRDTNGDDGGWLILYWPEPGIPEIIAQAQR